MIHISEALKNKLKKECEEKMILFKFMTEKEKEDLVTFGLSLMGAYIGAKAIPISGDKE